MSTENETDHCPISHRRRLTPIWGLLTLVLVAVVAVGCGGGAGETGNGWSDVVRDRASPAPRPEMVQPTVPAVPTNSLPDLPPVRRGFQPAPEQFAVMGDPSAPVTIVEYSDYQ